jgi:hypothetical protein
LGIWFASGLHPNIHWGLALISMWFGMAKPRRNQKNEWPNHMQTKNDFFSKTPPISVGDRSRVSKVLAAHLSTKPCIHCVGDIESGVYISTFMHMKIR